MSRDKIASRRAFIKKLAGTVAFIAPFMTTITVDALAKSNEDAPETRRVMTIVLILVQGIASGLVQLVVRKIRVGLYVW